MRLFEIIIAGTLSGWLCVALPSPAQDFPDEPQRPKTKKTSVGDSGPPAGLPDLDAPPAPSKKSNPVREIESLDARDTSPAALLKSMENSLEVVADDTNPAEVRSAFREAFGAILSTSEKILKHPRATDEQKNEALQYQASIYYQGARKGELGYADRLERLAEELHRTKPRSDVANLASFLSVKARYEEDDGLRSDALPAVMEYLKKYPREEAAIELLLGVAHSAEANGRNSVAKEALEIIPKSFKRHEVAGKVPAVLRRLDLVGKKLNLELPLMNGKKFSIDERKRLVIVEFWATWSPPCVGEQEILKDLYSRFKDDGLEIVGIPLDEKESTVQQHIAKHKVTWPQNVIQFDPKDSGFNHPIAKQYGVMQAPTNFLVENGKVVATQIRGQALRRKVEELIVKGSPTRLTDRIPDIK
jgi:thiol-disulfide isomerase/thioredoxin/TolA-binding protein